MKRNIWPRLAAVLLALTMASTSVIGGTLAKFVTSDSAADSARVAKFGLVATVSGDLFGPAYEVTGGAGGDKITHYTDNTATVTAVNQASALVTPGTKGGTLTISVKGTPEVGTRVTFDHAQNGSGASYALCEPELRPGTYGVMARYDGTVTTENYANYYYKSSGNYNPCTSADQAKTEQAKSTNNLFQLIDKAEVSTTYYPIVWKYSINGGAEVTNKRLSEAWSAIQTALNNQTKTPNQPVSFTATLTWEWPIGTTDAQHAKDTILGKTAATNLGEPWNDAVGGEIVAIYSGSTYKLCGINTFKIDDNNTARALYRSWIDNTWGNSSITKGGVAGVITAKFDARITIAQVD